MSGSLEGGVGLWKRVEVDERIEKTCAGCYELLALLALLA
jgi:hypothetical protein